MGLSDINVDEIQKSVARWIKEGKTTSAWNENTTCRVTQGLMSALRDFGILQGAVHKRIAPTYVPVTAFAYVMFYLKEHQPSGVKLVEHPNWRLFFRPMSRSFCPVKVSNGSCSRPTREVSWNTMRRAASPG